MHHGTSTIDGGSLFANQRDTHTHTHTRTHHQRNDRIITSSGPLSSLQRLRAYQSCISSFTILMYRTCQRA